MTETINKAAEKLMSFDEHELSRVLERIAQNAQPANYMFRTEAAELLAAQIDEIESEDEFTMALGSLAKCFGFRDATIVLAEQNSFLSYNRLLLSSMSPSKLETYLNMRLYNLDPGRTRCQSLDCVSFWELPYRPLQPNGVSSVDWNSVLGMAGATLQTRNSQGDTIHITLRSERNFSDLRLEIEPQVEDLTEILLLSSEKYSQIFCENGLRSPSLTDDQASVLYLLATGANIDELRERSFLFGSFDNVVTSICRLFGVSSLYQAIAMAIRNDDLRIPPLTRNTVILNRSLCEKRTQSEFE